MLSYNIKLAFKSVRRNPVLSVLMISAIGLGIGVSTTFITGQYIFSSDPIPAKSSRLHYVEIDNWDPNRPWNDSEPEDPPNQLTYRDMVGLMRSDIPTRQGGSFRASLFLHPDPKIGRPFKIIARMCFSDFFSLFEPPFEFGSGWDHRADKVPEPVVVLSYRTNQKIFGGENSIGRLVRIEDRDFKIVGVLKPWRVMPKYYDPHNGPFDEGEEAYMPFEHFQAFRIRSAGNTSNWKPFDWDNFQAYLDSEAIWIQYWVQLDTPAQKEAYSAFLKSYVEEQKKSGRMQRPMNNRLLTVPEWLVEAEVVPSEATTLMIISLLFLVVCSLNLIGVLLGKFFARASEISVRRAMGASRWQIFQQHVIECEVIGLAGGILGILLAILGLEAVTRLFNRMFELRLDLNMLAVAILLALIAGLLAGAYPAWRICSIPPARYLKEQ